MSLPGLLLLALVWTSLVWAGARLLALGLTPRGAQGLWRIAAGLVAAPFLLSLIVPALPGRIDAPLGDFPALEPFLVNPDAVFTHDAPASTLSLPDAGTLLLGLLVAGWAVRFGFWCASQLRLQRLKARAVPIERPLRHWAEALDLKSAPRVHLIPRGAPFLAGLRRPSVYLPVQLAGREGEAEIIVHEMVHLKRGDLIFRPFERLVADVFWFSPFAWAIRSELDYWREATVDQAAAELTGDRFAYARALTRAARIARPVTPLPVAAMILKPQGTLKMRLNTLLSDQPRTRRLSVSALALIASAAPLALAQGLVIRGPSIVAAAAPLASEIAPVAYTHPVLDKAKLTSAFGMRTHPITGEKKLHGGTDLADKLGAPVYAPASGTVTQAEFNEGYGNLVEVVAGATTLRFGQLDAMKVKTGDVVTAGTVIGTLGQSGQATGPHLHLEVWRGGERVDPQTEDGLILARSLKVSPASKSLAPIPEN